MAAGRAHKNEAIFPKPSSDVGYNFGMATKKWSTNVMERSDALDLESGIFTKSDPKAIARSLKRSAERSKRRKAEPFRSAMSMLNFFINRGGKNLPAKQKRVLEAAKDELRIAFGREPKGRSASGSRTHRTTRRTSTRRKTPKSRASARASRRSSRTR